MVVGALAFVGDVVAVAISVVVAPVVLFVLKCVTVFAA